MLDRKKMKANSSHAECPVQRSLQSTKKLRTEPMTTAISKSLGNTSSPTPVLALRPKEAAKSLGIGERLLWTLTKNGEIPHMRIGRAVVYPMDQLRDYLRKKSQASLELQS